MVDVAGFEPAASRMRTERSPSELHAHGQNVLFILNTAVEAVKEPGCDAADGDAPMQTPCGGCADFQ